MGKLFGTDGIRGVANKEWSVDLAMEVAQAAGTVIKEKTYMSSTHGIQAT